MTLRSLRTDNSLSYEQVAAHVSKFTKRTYGTDAPRMWEIRGLKTSDVIRALADLYKKSPEEIERAADASKNRKGPWSSRGRKPKEFIQTVS